jgi:hypothetical protein
VAVTTDIMEIIVHIVTRATDKEIIANTGTIAIGIIMATGERIEMVIESVYNPSTQFTPTPPSLC